MTKRVDVAIVGAGPYGLSVGAHLATAEVSTAQFGIPMNLWRTAMPKGMFLKSQGFASDLSSPDREHTLEAYCREKGLPYASYGLPVALEIFVGYGLWFREALVPDVVETTVTELRASDGGFELQLADGTSCRSSAVIVAAGVEHFAVVPDELAKLPPLRCSHSSEHDDLSTFAGKRVVVVGAGQSALESAALLHEGGASVQLIARANELKWNGAPLPLDRPLLQRLREPEAGLGSGWKTWFYSVHPEWFRHLPANTRIERARTVLGPAGAAWLSDRVIGKVDVATGQAIRWAKEVDDEVALGLEDARGTATEVRCDHVIVATGYRSDLSRLTFLTPELRSSIRTIAGTPEVDGNYQSAVPGLHFVGPAVAPTFGPVMRFVYGSDHAASTVGRRFGAQRARTAKQRHAVR
jgi:FAD-dependent urate hydroxylase